MKQKQPNDSPCCKILRAIPAKSLANAIVDLVNIFPVNAAKLGYVRDFSHGNGVDVGLGGQFTLNFWPNELNRFYGDGPGYGFQIFLRIRPSLHGMDTAQMESSPK